MTSTRETILAALHARLSALPAAALKQVTHNEAIQLLDGLVRMSVIVRDLFAPPSSPSDGDRYIVGSGATGNWTGWT